MVLPLQWSKTQKQQRGNKKMFDLNHVKFLATKVKLKFPFENCLLALIYEHRLVFNSKISE